MRELVLKALTSTENKKKDYSVLETIEKDGVFAETQRRCFYFVLGNMHIDNPADVEQLSRLNFSNLPPRRRHYYILKVRDSRHGEDRLICKVAGSFYAVCGNEIYCIAFVHSFKIKFIEQRQT